MATKRNYSWQTTGKMLLAGCMVTLLLAAILFCLPQPFAYAADTIKAPSSASYADPSGIPQFTEIYYGVEGKTWLTAGTEDGALVLLCNPNNNYGQTAFNTTDYSVYKSSKLDLAIKALYIYGDEHFTAAEIARMKEVTLQKYPSNGPIKMYAVDGNNGGTQLYLGANSTIIMDISHLTGRSFWLRTPANEHMVYTMLFPAGICWAGTSYEYGILPAFHLDQSSVLFLSTALPNFANASYEDAMYVRYKDTGNYISAKAAATKDGVTISGAGEEEYLYVQYSVNGVDKLYSCQAKDGTIPSAAIGAALNASCKIWIEKKNISENTVYAKQVVFHEHSWDTGKVTKAATYDTAGVRTYTCKICQLTKTEGIAKLAAATGSTVSIGDATYKVTGASTVSYAGTTGKVADISVPAKVTIGGKAYTVNAIAPNAFANNKQLKSVIIPKSVTSIGKKAFFKCSNLRKITIKTSKLNSKNVGAKAFAKIHKKANAKVPKKKLSAYKTLLKAKGLNGKTQTIHK